MRKISALHDGVGEIGALPDRGHLGLPGQDPLANPESSHLSAVGQGRVKAKEIARRSIANPGLAGVAPTKPELLAYVREAIDFA